MLNTLDMFFSCILTNSMSAEAPNILSDEASEANINMVLKKLTQPIEEQKRTNDELKKTNELLFQLIKNKRYL